MPSKAELYKMYAKAMKMMPGSSNQKELIKKIDALRKKLGMNEASSASQIKKMRDDFKKTGDLPPHLKKLAKGKKEFEKKFKVKDIVIPGMEWMSKLGEERDYKDEYKKFQSSTKSKKYRAELNKYNRKKGTYGNGDGKDASHKRGKIVGFESESKNRGRAEKSRLKKEVSVKEGTCGYGIDGKLGDEPAGPHLMKKKKIKERKLNENPAAIAAATAMTKIKMNNPKTGKKISAVTALRDKDNPNHKKAKSIFAKLKDRFSKKKDDKKAAPKKQSKSDADFYKRQYTGESVNEASTIDKIKDIVKNKQNMKIGGVRVDMQTANAIMAVHKALGQSNKKKYEKLPIKKMASVAFKLLK